MFSGGSKGNIEKQKVNSYFNVYYKGKTPLTFNLCSFYSFLVKEGGALKAT